MKQSNKRSLSIFMLILVQTQRMQVYTFLNSYYNSFFASTGKWIKPIGMVSFLLVICLASIKAQGTGTPSDPWIRTITTAGQGNITANGYYLIRGGTVATPARNSITVRQNLNNVHITLENVHIRSSTRAFTIEAGATVYLTLEGENTLTSDGIGYAGIHVPAIASIASLFINGPGAITVQGGIGAQNQGSGAGIGGNGGSNSYSTANYNSCGNITIYGGKIIAKAGNTTGGNSGSGAGIGGGGGGGSQITGGNTVGKITIEGGTISATGGMVAYTSGSGGGSGAGIGGGGSGHHSPAGGANLGGISITGGTVEATGGKSADCAGAGIGGGGAQSSGSGGKLCPGLGNAFFDPMLCGNLLIGDDAIVIPEGGNGDAADGPPIGNGGQIYGASVPRNIIITKEPADITFISVDHISGNELGVQAMISPTTKVTFTYQWYSATGIDGDGKPTGGNPISGKTSASFLIPNNLEAGKTYYYYCVVGATPPTPGLFTVIPATSRVATVIIEKDMNKAITVWNGNRRIEESTVNFESRAVGYLTSPSMTITAANNGNVPFTNGKLTYFPEENFLNNPPSVIAEIGLNNSVSFPLQPKPELGKGIYNVTVAVSDDENEDFGWFNVQFSVIDKDIETITIIGEPGEMTYTEGETPDLSGLMVKIKYFGDVNTVDVVFGEDDFSEYGLTITPAPDAPLLFSADNGKPITVSYGNTSAETNEKITIRLQVTVNSDGIDKSGDGYYNVNDPVTINAGTPPEGTRFSRWEINPRNVNLSDRTASVTSFNMPASNVTVTANFEPIPPTYAVSVSANPSAGGEVSGGGIYEQGQTAIVEATANENYEFVNWTEDGERVSDEAEYTFTVNEDVDLVANFALKTYTVTFVDWDGKQIDEQIVSHGSAASAPDDPEREGYSFTGWDVAFDEITSGLTVTALYQIISYGTRTVGVSAYPVAGGTVSGGGIYPYNNEVIVKASPNTDYNFVNWTVDGKNISNETEHTFTVTENVELVANFVLKNIPITVTVSGNPIESNEGIYSAVADCGSMEANVNVNVDHDATVEINGVAQNSRTVALPDYGDNIINIRITNQTYIKTYTLIILRYYDQLMYEYADVPTINCNQQTNGGYVFTAFQWYMNDAVISGANLPYYRISNDQATYYCEITLDNGKKWRTCPIRLNLQQTSSLMVYPNPTQGLLSISNDEQLFTGKIQVFNVYGSLVLQPYTNPFDMSGLPEGVYVIKVDNETISVVVKK